MFKTYQHLCKNTTTNNNNIDCGNLDNQSEISYMNMVLVVT